MLNTNITGHSPFYLTRDLFYFSDDVKRGGGPEIPVARALPLAPIAQAVPFAQPVPSNQVLSNERPKQTREQSTYPYFTTNVLLPLANFQSLNRSECIDLFFDRQKFYYFIRNFRRTTDPAEQSANAKNNVIVMLELFFPTSFPSKQNIHSSYDDKIKQIPLVTNQGDSVIPDFILNYFHANPQQFSYLQIGGAKYTVTSVTWLNDVVNHPDYNKLIREVHKYTIWEQNLKKTTRRQIETLKKQFLNTWKKCADLFKEYINITGIGALIKRIFESIYFEQDINKQIKKVADLDKYRHEKNADLPREIIYNDNVTKLLRISTSVHTLNQTLDYFEDPSQFPDLFVKQEKEYDDFAGLRNILLRYPVFINTMRYISSFVAPYYNSVSQGREGSEIAASGSVLRETSNVKLQNTITQFVNSSADKMSSMNQAPISLKNFAEVVVNKYLNEQTRTDVDDTDVSDLMNTDVVTLHNSNAADKKEDQVVQENSMYEIYLEVDVVKGILNYENIGKLFCQYRGSLLEKMYEQLKYHKANDVTMSKNRPMFNVEVLLRNSKTEKTEGATSRTNQDKMRGGFIPPLPIQQTITLKKTKTAKTKSPKTKTPNNQSVKHIK